jgi:hypothetical protein
MHVHVHAGAWMEDGSGWSPKRLPVHVPVSPQGQRFLTESTEQTPWQPGACFNAEHT